MKTAFIHRLLLACSLALAVVSARAAEEQDLIATLRSSAGAPEKWAACQRLRMVGSPQAVPALAALLTEERAGHAARHALEGLPYPEAGAALREALGRTSGLLQAGIIDSLGWRGEPAAVPMLAPLLADADVTIAGTSAAALGRIGGPEAIAALTKARGAAPALVHPAVVESLLQCAEGLRTANQSADAAAIYRELLDTKEAAQVRSGAWRGLVLSDPGQRTELIVQALTGTDRPIHAAALKLIRELSDRSAIQACLSHWAQLPADSQLAVLEAQVKLGAEALPTARTASQSADPALRTAAWRAMGELNDTTSVLALAKAAAGQDVAEADAARETLARLRGPGAREALLTQIQTAAAPEKAELLRSLGERGDRAAVDVLLQNAASDNEPVRLAALESVRRLAPPEAIAPLLDIAAKSRSDQQRDPVLKALYAVCEASPDKERTARSVVDSLSRFPAAERRQILPLLAEFSTPEALAAAESASRDPDLELAKAAVRVLAQWPNGAPARHLLDLAGASTDPTLRILALRGAIEAAGQEPEPGKRLATLKQAMAAAQGLEEKKQALGQVGQVPTPEALDLALTHFADPDLASEASLAAISIAEKLAPTDPKLADSTAAKVLTQVKDGDVARRAWALRLKPSSGASFIRDWVVCGPFNQAGIVGANAVFNIPFGPEKPGQKASWTAAAPADSVNLAALFPGRDNCAAYLRTVITAPQDGRAVLLLGSDDGVKAWLNGALVHSNNVDRGQVADQDAAPIQLKKGPNELMLKVSQGGGGWSVCARVAGEDGKPIPGLLVERPTGPSQALSSAAVNR